MHRRSHLFVPIISGILIGVSSLFAERMPVSASQQVDLIQKILKQDRSIGNQSDGVITIGLVYFPGDSRLMDAEKTEILNAFHSLDGHKIKGKQIKTVEIKFESMNAFKQQCSNAGVDVLYLMPAEKSRIRPLTQYSSQQKILTISGMIDHMTQWVSIAVSKAGDSNKIFLNLEQSKTEGASFPANFIKITQLVSPN